MSVASIETRYAGCRFRSRLEARWARFFDHLQIRWQYEPQGIVAPDRLNLDGGGEAAYLPDFWLPDLGMWAEAKGLWSPDEARRFLSAAAHLSEHGADVLLLPPIPRVDGEKFPSLAVFHYSDGELAEHAWHPGCGVDSAPYMQRMRTVARTGEMDCTPGDLFAFWRWRMVGRNTPPVVLGYIRALEAARSARFEHGEEG